MDPRVAAVIGVMRESLIERVSVGALSKRVNLSSTRLRQLFKREIGRSPLQYLGDLRMDHAELLLGSTFLSIKEVAFVCGVKDVSNFVRRFKRRRGLTPTEFRARMQPSLD